MAAALLGGAIVTQYVDTHVFSLVAPALLGVSCGWVTEAAAGRRLRGAALAAAAGALLGTALGFRLVPGGPGVLSSWAEVGPPYLCAVAAALGWPLLSGPGSRHAAHGSGTMR